MPNESKTPEEYVSDALALMRGICATRVARARDPDAALGIVDHLRRRFARFKLCAHFLDLRGLFF
jgi:hypothetical protein